MNKFSYRIYYKYLGPTKDDPFGTEPLSPDQVQPYLDALRAKLPNHFSVTANDNSLYVAADTSDSEQDTDRALERCVVDLNRSTSGLSLLIERLSE